MRTSCFVLEKKTDRSPDFWLLANTFGREKPGASHIKIPDALIGKVLSDVAIHKDWRSLVPSKYMSHAEFDFVCQPVLNALNPAGDSSANVSLPVETFCSFQRRHTWVTT
jgi:hypothetical protein